MKLLDLFSGFGGFSLGLEFTGFETIAFCEIEDYPRKVLAKHWPDVPIAGDIRKLTYKNGELIYDGQIIYRGTINAICGGFPCQDLSTAGKQAGIDGERSGLFFEYSRLISEILPDYAIMENVTNLLNGQRGAWFSRVLGELAKIGYDAEWHCIPASHVGAPHQRDRAWIIANPASKRQQRQGQLIKSISAKKDSYREADWLVNAFHEKSLPYVCRRHDGIPARMDRIKGLGNAVVPQIPELIGRAIMKHENNND